MSLICMGRYSGYSESLIGPWVILLVLPCSDSNYIKNLTKNLKIIQEILESSKGSNETGQAPSLVSTFTVCSMYA